MADESEIAFLESSDSDDDDSFEGFLENEATHEKDEADSSSDGSCDESPKESDSDSDKKKAKRSGRRVSFAPGLVSGKSDVKRIAETEVKERVSKRPAFASLSDGTNADIQKAAIQQTRALYPFDPAVSVSSIATEGDMDRRKAPGSAQKEASESCDLKEANCKSGEFVDSGKGDVKQSEDSCAHKAKPASSSEPLATRTLEMTEWMSFGGSLAFSGSETSDTEMDFSRLNERYSHWNSFNASDKRKAAERWGKQEQMEEELQETESRLESLKGALEEKCGHDSEKVDALQSRVKKEFTAERVRKYKRKQRQKGVIYVSSLPFGCTSLQLKKIFTEFGTVTNIHLESRKDSKGEEKKIFGKWAEYAEAWVEMSDKSVAKMVARVLNGTKVPKRYTRNRNARGHEWDLRYLKGFKWHKLLEHKAQLRVRQRKKFENAVAEANRQASYYREQIAKAQRLSGAQPGDELQTTRKAKRSRLDMQCIVAKTADSDTKHVVDSLNAADAYDSSDDELPPMKKRKTVPQRRAIKHRQKGNRLTALSKSMLKSSA